MIPGEGKLAVFHGGLLNYQLFPGFGEPGFKVAYYSFSETQLRALRNSL